MIVKIKGTEEHSDSWRWYEADSVQACTKGMSHWANESGVLELICGEGINEEAIIAENLLETADSPVTLISFKSADGTCNNIYANTSAYLLNNQGETLDRLI
jgi:hypothetical protein